MLVFVSSPLVGDVTKDSFSSGISIFSAFKLSTPDLNNVN